MYISSGRDIFRRHDHHCSYSSCLNCIHLPGMEVAVNYLATSKRVALEPVDERNIVAITAEEAEAEKAEKAVDQSYMSSSWG